MLGIKMNIKPLPQKIKKQDKLFFLFIVLLILIFLLITAYPFFKGAKSSSQTTEQLEVSEPGQNEAESAAQEIPAVQEESIENTNILQTNIIAKKNTKVNDTAWTYQKNPDEQLPPLQRLRYQFDTENKEEYFKRYLKTIEPQHMMKGTSMIGMHNFHMLMQPYFPTASIYSMFYNESITHTSFPNQGFEQGLEHWNIFTGSAQIVSDKNCLSGSCLEVKYTDRYPSISLRTLPQRVDTERLYWTPVYVKCIDCSNNSVHLSLYSAHIQGDTISPFGIIRSTYPLKTDDAYRAYILVGPVISQYNNALMMMLFANGEGTNISTSYHLYVDMPDEESQLDPLGEKYYNWHKERKSLKIPDILEIVDDNPSMIEEAIKLGYYTEVDVFNFYRPYIYKYLNGSKYANLTYSQAVEKYGNT